MDTPTMDTTPTFLEKLADPSLAAVEDDYRYRKVLPKHPVYPVEHLLRDSTVKYTRIQHDHDNEAPLTIALPNLSSEDSQARIVVCNKASLTKENQDALVAFIINSQLSRTVDDQQINMLWRLVNQQAKQIAELQDEITLQDEEEAKLKKQVKDLRIQVAGTRQPEARPRFPSTPTARAPRPDAQSTFMMEDFLNNAYQSSSPQLAATLCLDASFAPYDTGNPYVSNSRVEEPTQHTAIAQPSRLSAKIPDPPILTDGKDPPYKHWDFQMSNKLIGNAD
ncbi:hypothetical protein K469DRAFT_56848 [Zopfia rhizophila CBS 207.26]|uniref:Uncharacterized protein n=1 Tax=Zopfia rhizophila CBS 207.26 TaxID=1314779 RepID=A0A6A6DCC2_9PEZI|nr:hypothetical protein K469DRAFT_56848 [Zopfia rhizophila CBS 207.26]